MWPHRAMSQSTRAARRHLIHRRMHRRAGDRLLHSCRVAREAVCHEPCNPVAWIRLRRSGRVLGRRPRPDQAPDLGPRRRPRPPALRRRLPWRPRRASRMAPPPPAGALLPQSLGPLQPTPLEIPPGSQAAPFDQSRTLNLPAGFRAQVFASGLTNPRMMAFDDRGVSTSPRPATARWWRSPTAMATAWPTRCSPSRAASQAHGLEFRDGWLYVANTDSVVRLGGAPGDLVAASVGEGGAEHPQRRGHFTRTLGFGPDGGLYVSVGSSCNVCRERDPERAAVVALSSPTAAASASTRRACAMPWASHGVPGTDELWATNNGRDNLGDDVPPETLNLVRDGDDFGWPRCHNGRIVDPGVRRRPGLVTAWPRRARRCRPMRRRSAWRSTGRQQRHRRRPRLVEPLGARAAAPRARTAAIRRPERGRGLRHRLAAWSRQRHPLGPRRGCRRRPGRQPVRLRRRRAGAIYRLTTAAELVVERPVRKPAGRPYD